MPVNSELQYGVRVVQKPALHFGQTSLVPGWKLRTAHRRAWMDVGKWLKGGAYPTYCSIVHILLFVLVSFTCCQESRPEKEYYRDTALTIESDWPILPRLRWKRKEKGKTICIYLLATKWMHRLATCAPRSFPSTVTMLLYNGKHWCVVWCWSSIRLSTQRSYRADCAPWQKKKDGKRLAPGWNVAGYYTERITLHNARS